MTQKGLCELMKKSKILEVRIQERRYIEIDIEPFLQAQKNFCITIIPRRSKNGSKLLIVKSSCGESRTFAARGAVSPPEVNKGAASRV